MYVNVNAYYRGTCPTEEDVRSFEPMLLMHFVDINFLPIEGESFEFTSPYLSVAICNGNPDLSYGDLFKLAGTVSCYLMTDKWTFPISGGTHVVKCKKGDYIILTFTPSTMLEWIVKKVLDSFKLIRE